MGVRRRKFMASKIKKVTPDSALILGIDPSLNGSGFTLMKNKEVLKHYFFTDTVKDAKNSNGHGVLNRNTGPKRLIVVQDWFRNFLLEIKEEYGKFPDYAGIEDYAYGARSNSTFQIGGLGEMIRVDLYRSGIPYRDYEPSKVKKYATGDGSAKKSQMVLEAFKEGFDVSPYGTSGEDLADSYWIGRMLHMELILHNNSKYIHTLPKIKREIFTGISKAYPIPIINRPFVSDRGE